MVRDTSHDGGPRVVAIDCMREDDVCVSKDAKTACTRPFSVCFRVKKKRTLYILPQDEFMVSRD